MRPVFVAVLASLSALAALSLAAAEGVPDRYCLHGPQWEYPGKCRYTSYFHCITEAARTPSARRIPDTNMAVSDQLRATEWQS